MASVCHAAILDNMTISEFLVVKSVSNEYRDVWLFLITCYCVYDRLGNWKRKINRQER